MTTVAIRPANTFVPSVVAPSMTSFANNNWSPHPTPSVTAAAVEVSDMISGQESSPGRSDTESDPSSRRDPRTTPFLVKLAAILREGSHRDLIDWTEDGQSIIVKHLDVFASTVLPKYFKHSKFASFLRQLNMYSFYTVDKAQEKGEWRVLHNPLFTRDNIRADLIQRKIPKCRLLRRERRLAEALQKQQSMAAGADHGASSPPLISVAPFVAATHAAAAPSALAVTASVKAAHDETRKRSAAAITATSADVNANAAAQVATPTETMSALHAACRRYSKAVREALKHITAMQQQLQHCPPDMATALLPHSAAAAAVLSSSDLLEWMLCVDGGNSKRQRVSPPSVSAAEAASAGFTPASQAIPATAAAATAAMDSGSGGQELDSVFYQPTYTSLPAVLRGEQLQSAVSQASLVSQVSQDGNTRATASMSGSPSTPQRRSASPDAPSQGFARASAAAQRHSVWGGEGSQPPPAAEGSQHSAYSRYNDDGSQSGTPGDPGHWRYGYEFDNSFQCPSGDAWQGQGGDSRDYYE